MGVVLGVLAAALFVASTLTEGLASAATNLSAEPDQEYSKHAGDLKVPDYFRSADVVIDQNEMNFYEACANYNGDAKYGTSRYSVTINNNPTFKNEPLLQCMKHERQKSDGRQVFDNKNTYSIGIKPKYGSKGTQYILEKNHNYSLSNVSIDIVSQDAAHDRFNENKRYDVIFHITDIKIVTGTFNNVKSDRGDTDTGLAILYGFEKDTNGKSQSWFSAQQYLGHRHIAVGVKYNITVELIDRSVEDETLRKPRKTVVWMLSDIDIAEKLKGEDASKESKRKRYTYSSEHSYAEHVKLLSGGVTIAEDEKLQAKNEEKWHKAENMIPVSWAPCKPNGPNELGIATDGAIYHKYKSYTKNQCVPSGKYSGNVTDNSTDALFEVKINDPAEPFKFEWGGSGCATMIASAPYVDETDDDHYYNYELKPYVTNRATKAAYIGSSITMEPGVVVAVRRDTLLGNDDDQNTYATITKETEVKYSYWFTDAAGNITGGVQEARETENRRFNDEGGLNTKFLESTDEQLEEITIDIDDSRIVGGRICIELSVYPFESHDGTNNIPVSYKETSDISTRRATASCLPIAKRPTMSVESSNVYSATNIYTLTYGKNIGSARHNFGSWSEYGVYGRVHSSALMASGAALGYSRDGYTGGKNLNVARENPGEGNKVSTTNNSNDCTFMTQTFANAECKQDENASPIGDITADQFRERMIERYKDNSSMALVGVTQKQFGGVQYSDVSNIDPTINAFYNSKTGFASVKAGNLYLSKTPSFASDDREHNHTIVYQATNLIIDGDLNKELTKSMISPYDTTGVVILADRVYLTDRTTYVNATIIADEVNTCAFQAANPSQKLKMSNLNSNICNSSVIFDQPVVTKRLILNRTAGANSGTGSIVRAEVFNLNFGNYLWSYSQMARYSQAVTSFAREISPRY